MTEENSSMDTNSRPTVTRSVGEVAKLLKVNASLLRYYDDEGIVKPTVLSDAGYRLYTPEDVYRLDVAVALRATGLPLRDIKDAMNRPEAVETVLRHHLTYLDEQMERMKRAQSILYATLEATENNGADTLVTLRSVASIQDLDDKEQQDCLMNHIQNLLQKLMPQRGRLTTQELTSLQTYLFGNTFRQDQSTARSARSSSKEPSADPSETAVARGKALVRMQQLTEHPEPIQKWMDDLRPLLDELKSMPQPKSAQDMRDLTVGFYHDLREMLGAGTAPDSDEVQLFLDNYFTRVAEAVGMTYEAYQAWVRRVFEPWQDATVPQTITSLLALNSNRKQSNEQEKALFQKALEVWRERTFPDWPKAPPQSN